MSGGTVLVKNYAPDDRFAVSEREIWRYAGIPAGTEPGGELREMLRHVLDELSGMVSFRVCWLRADIIRQGDVMLHPVPTESADLAKCLRGCGEAVVFAATTGLALDRYIARNQRISPTKALLAQAYGAERAERLCDVFCTGMKELAAGEGLLCTPRFSPGYGDLPLTVQRDIFRLLECERHIGLSLNEGLLMSPSKSVTAVFGLRKADAGAK